MPPPFDAARFAHLIPESQRRGPEGFFNSLLTLLAGLLAAASFGMPAAYAEHSGSNITDGFTLADRDREHGFAGQVLVAATPMQRAQLAYSERSRSVSDGISAGDWEKRQSPELQEMMAKMANDPAIEALFAYFESQRRSFDGRG